MIAEQSWVTLFMILSSGPEEQVLQQTLDTCDKRHLKLSSGNTNEAFSALCLPSPAQIYFLYLSPLLSSSTGNTRPSVSSASDSHKFCHSKWASASLATSTQFNFSVHCWKIVLRPTKTPKCLNRKLPGRYLQRKGIYISVSSTP